MSEYRKLNLDSITFSNEVVSYDDATKNAFSFDIKEENIQHQEVKITNAEKDYEKKCVKLAISY